MRHFTKKLTSNHAQHSVEYAVIMILVMASIIISSPFVIRSWNANMQGWEDSVIDSLDDPLKEAPPNTTLPLCACAWSVATPTFDCALGSCPQTTMLEQCNCTPIGCGISSGAVTCVDASGNIGVEGAQRCICDASCCATPTPTGLCGPPGCPDGQMQMTQDCGTFANASPCAASTTICVPDPACTFDCTTPLVEPPNSSHCPGFEAGLTVDTPITLVNACGPTTAHCEIICDLPYFPVAGNTGCGLCLPGTIAQGSCGAALTCETPLMCAQGQCLAS